MDLYIRALTIYPGVVTLYAGLLLLDIVTALVNRLMQLTSVKFISKLLPTYGWRIEKPFSFVRDDSHYVERRPNIIPTLMTGILVFISALSISYIALVCEGADVYPYMYCGVLQLLTSLTLWYKHIQAYLSVRQHSEQLVVVENCQCLTDPFKTILLLQGYHDECYTYTVPNTEHWVIGMYHKADCLGDYVVELDPENIDSEHAIWVGVGDKIAHTRMNGVAFPITLIVMAAVSFAAFIWFRYLSLLTFGSTLLISAMFFMPWHITKKLKLVSISRTEVYDDIDMLGAFTFVLIGNNGRPYYYQCDDRDALTVNGTYICEVKGNTIVYVSDHLDTDIGATYQKVDSTSGMWIFMLLIACGVATCEFLNWVPIAVASSIILALWLALTLRYKTKGEI